MQKVWISSKIQSLKSHPFGTAIMLFILLAVVLLIIQLSVETIEDRIDREHYVYDTYEADNDVLLHVIRTKPQYIHLQSIHNNVTETGFNGINGGFFWQEQLLSIAVMNHYPTQGEPKGYGSGWGEYESE